MSNSKNHRDVDKVFVWSPKVKRFLPEWWRRAVLPTWLAPDPGITTLPLVINAAAGRPVKTNYKQVYGSNQGLDAGLGTPLRLDAMVFEDSTDTTALADWTIFMEEVGESRRFMNLPIHIRTLAGTAQLPGVFRENYYMLSNNMITATFEKVAGGAVNVRPFFIGGQYYPWSTDILAWPEQRAYLHNLIKKMAKRKQYVWPYWFTTDPSPIVLAANATARFAVPVGDDSHFEAMAMTQVSTGNFSLQITETKTRQTLMNGPVTEVNAIGDAQFPSLFPKPYLVPAGEVLVFDFTDLSGAQNTIHFTLQGRRLYAPLKNAREVERDTRVMIDSYEDIMMTLPSMAGKGLVHA